MDFKSSMKNLIIILLALSFISCNHLINKDLRRKNKCNRKFEKVINKCPELLIQDTTIAVYDTTIITQGSKADTVVSFDFDTITLFKDKLRLKLIRTRDTLIIDGECLPDTIRIKEYIKVPHSKASMIKLSFWENIMNGAKDFWWIVVLFISIFLLYKYIKKKFL